MPTRETILNTLAEEQEKLLARYALFTPEELETPCTESEVPGGAPWRPKDHLAHLALIERAFQGMARRTLKGSADPVGFSRTGATNREEILAWIHRNNQQYVEAHHDDSLETLLADLTDARKDTLAMLEQLTDEQLAMPIPGAPWGDGTISGVLMTNARHATMHVAWIEEGLRLKAVQ
ncbi:MAG TPA: DinB family protein [Ktedonobacteraceae bacterium]|nr:DinB family protein [Ktedonobacteraceae bacterium]